MQVRHADQRKALDYACVRSFAQIQPIPEML
jgi:hypothetical protein